MLVRRLLTTAVSALGGLALLMASAALARTSDDHPTCSFTGPCVTAVSVSSD